MNKALYHLFIKSYALLIRFASPFNPKAKAWIEGRRKNGLHKAHFPAKEKPRIWFHISSLGEYEQAKPLIEVLGEDHELVITFFSPSGFEANKAQKHTNNVFYLPVDTAANMRTCMELVKPDLLVLVKYDFWYHLVSEATRAGIPVVATSVLLRPEQVYFKWYGAFFKRILQRVSHFCTQDESSKKLLQSIGISNATVCGDTRVDSVVKSKGEKELPSLIGDFVEGHACLVAGSTYSVEERILQKVSEALKDDNWKLIIAPHNVSKERISQIQNLFEHNAVCLSELQRESLHKQVLIIDSIGLLMHLYAIADIALIGGGFGKTVHNTLEPAAYGIPLLYGPHYSKFTEAVAFVEQGAARVLSENEFGPETAIWFRDSEKRKEAGAIAQGYIDANFGASPRSLRVIREQLI